RKNSSSSGGGSGGGGSSDSGHSSGYGLSSFGHKKLSSRGGPAGADQADKDKSQRRGRGASNPIAAVGGKRRGAGREKDSSTDLLYQIRGSSGGRRGHSRDKHDAEADYETDAAPILRPDVDYPWTRFTLAEEREIYRLAHKKLSSPGRPLLPQVLLSNFMYSYLAKVQAANPHMALPTSAAQNSAMKQQAAQQEALLQQQREEQQRVAQEAALAAASNGGGGVGQSDGRVPVADAGAPGAVGGDGRGQVRGAGAASGGAVGGGADRAADERGRDAGDRARGSW
ncbi:hypothetical protein KEM52_004465, partial [Ascosphaera acerosa]